MIARCKCCGGEGEHDIARYPDKHFVACQDIHNCCVTGPEKPTKEEAIAAWNALMQPAEWLPIESAPEENMAVTVYFQNRNWTYPSGENVSFGEVRDVAERSETAFYQDGSWYQSGTGHDLFEDPWNRNDQPTHWQPLFPPPEAQGGWDGSL